MPAVNAGDEALDALYAAAPDAFVDTRRALAQRLKREGDAEGAAAVARARKPTQVAYVLNQLARRRPDDVAALVDAGRDLARAERRALRGGSGAGGLKEAIGRQRAIVRELTTKAAALMRELGVETSGHLADVTGALQAALVDPAAGAALEEARLVEPPAAAAGFSAALAGAKIGPPLAKTRPKADEDAKAKARAEALAAEARAARRAADEAKRAAARAEAEAKKRERVARAAERAATKARAG